MIFIEVAMDRIRVVLLKKHCSKVVMMVIYKVAIDVRMTLIKLVEMDMAKKI